MPKVFMNLYEDDEMTEDLEGAEYADLAEAKRDAETSLHEMIAEDVKNERPLVSRSIEIVSENGSIIATVEIEGRVTMHQTTEN